MNAAGDTKSTLGTDPWKEDLGFDIRLEALDTDREVSKSVLWLWWTLPKNEVTYLWNATRGLDCGLETTRSL
jgi:hypothetical protein